MDVLICLDHRFVMPCGVMLRSLFDNNPDSEITCHAFIDESITQEDKKDLISIAGSSKLKYYLIDDVFLGKIPKPLNSNYSKMNYARLFTSSILPNSINKILYLDCDTIVCKSLSSLWNISITDFAVGAVVDVIQGDDVYDRMHIDKNKYYFNSGVLLINLEYWRLHNIENQFTSYISNVTDSKQLKFVDQDVLNYILQDSWYRLPAKFNTLTAFFRLKNSRSYLYGSFKNEIDEATTDPFILHFAGRIRPWYRNCIHPMKEEFEKYYMRTQWAGIPFKRKKEKIRWYIAHFLKKMLI